MDKGCNILWILITVSFMIEFALASKIKCLVFLVVEGRGEHSQWKIPVTQIVAILWVTVQVSFSVFSD